MTKPIFGFDLTEDKTDPKTYSTIFESKRLGEKMSTELEQKQQTVQNTLKAAKLPPLLTAVEYIGIFFGLMVVCPLISVDGGFLQGIRNAPILSLTGIFSLVLGIVLWLVSKAKEKRVLSKEKAEEKIEDLESYAKQAFDSLNVPEDAIDTDILLFNFVFKGEKMKPHTLALSPTPFWNFPCKLFLKDYNLCIADVETVYSFPLEELKSINKINKTAILPKWNKEERFNKGEYKKYKIGWSNSGIHTKPYYVLELDHKGERYGIYFPCYELPTIERLTALKATGEEGIKQ